MLKPRSEYACILFNDTQALLHPYKTREDSNPKRLNLMFGMAQLHGALALRKIATQLDQPEGPTVPADVSGGAPRHP